MALLNISKADRCRIGRALTMLVNEMERYNECVFSNNGPRDSVVDVKPYINLCLRFNTK